MEMEHPFIKYPGHHIDVLAQVLQDFPGTFNGIVIGDQVELDIRTDLLELGPQIQQEIHRSHGTGPQPDHLLLLLPGRLGPLDGILAVLDQIPGILEQGFPSRGQFQSPVGPAEQPQIQGRLQQIDLLDHRRRRNMKVFRRFIEAASFRHLQKGEKLGIVQRIGHGNHPPL